MTVRSFAPQRPGAARHAKTGFLSELLSQAPARKTTSRLSPHTAASSRRAADATPGRRDGAARHPRASATAATTRQAVRCGSLATTGTAGRRRLRVPMPATWASATAFSPDRPAKRPVGAVFSCVASKNRSRKTTVAKHQLKRFGLAPTPPEAALRPGR